MRLTWKLLFSKKGELELYNMNDDAVEENNRIAEHPELAKNLQMKYEKWRSEMGKPIGKPKSEKKKNKKKEE